MADKKKVMILFGGVSSEHEVSRASAASILKHIDDEKYEIIKAGISRTGRWFLTKASPADIESGLWEERGDNREIRIIPGKGFDGIDVDLVFPLLHGRNGEDGRMQGFLQIVGVPYIGSDLSSSAACMDKAIAKAIIDQAEVCAQAACCVVHGGCDVREASEAIDDFFDGSYPLFVKPANAGSSIGITRVVSMDELTPAIETAFAEDGKVIVEEAIEGREIEVALLGNAGAARGEDLPRASCIGEIFAANEFYDYRAKYDNIGSRTSIVRDLSKEKEEEIRSTAERIYEIMECDGLARADFFLKPGAGGGYDDGELVFNEINTMPGFTEISMYSKLWEASGLGYAELIDRLIDLALKKRGTEESRNDKGKDQF